MGYAYKVKTLEVVSIRVLLFVYIYFISLVSGFIISNL